MLSCEGVDSVKSDLKLLVERRAVRDAASGCGLTWALVAGEGTVWLVQGVRGTTPLKMYEVKKQPDGHLSSKQCDKAVQT